MTVIKVDHLAVVVDDMPQALHFWRDVLGLPLTHTETNPTEAVDISFLTVGESQIELLKPTTDDSGIAKFLSKRGAGIHHVCVVVQNIDETLQQLHDHDVELINDVPRTREDGTRYAFVHPRSTGGVLLELYQYPQDKETT